MKNITYKNGNALDLDALLELYRDSTLGERRPVEDRGRMIHHRLRVRNVSCRFAVRRAYQRGGIGKELIRRTQDAAPKAMLLLLAAPAAEKYYPHIGFTIFRRPGYCGPEKKWCNKRNG